jgi:MFS family permease
MGGFSFQVIIARKSEEPMPKSKPDFILNPDDLFAAEYEYISNTVFQANEDRSRIASFYFVSVGSIVAAILGTQFAPEKIQSVSPALAVLFFFLTILGALTIAQLARLRAAWHESVQAMNQLKDFYIKHYPDIAPAFKWRGTTIPPTDKPFSIANLIAREVALLGAITTSAAAYFLLIAFGPIASWGWGAIIISFFVGIFLQWRWYKSLLVDDR